VKAMRWGMGRSTGNSNPPEGHHVIHHTMLGPHCAGNNAESGKMADPESILNRSIHLSISIFISSIPTRRTRRDFPLFYFYSILGSMS
jgi:hypothetical protein